MTTNSPSRSVLTVAVVVLATLSPLIALPTAMLSLLSKENESPANSASSSQSTAASSNHFQGDEKVGDEKVVGTK